MIGYAWRTLSYLVSTILIGGAAMKAHTTAVMMGGLAMVIWAGATSHDLLAMAEPGPQTASNVLQAPQQTPKASDAERRAALNARLSSMLLEGKGARLVDPQKTERLRAPLPQRRLAEPVARNGISRPETLGTVAPPAYNPTLATPRSTGGYKPPRLNLTTPIIAPTDPIECLTQAIYYEARNESEDGQFAVAEVVMNRAGSGRYPRDVCQVVYQRNSRTCQFTFTCDGSIGRSPINTTAWARAERIARSVHVGEAKALLPRNSVNYHANYVSPTWARRLERVRRIGAHIFYGVPIDRRPTPGAEPTISEPLTFVKNDVLERAYALMKARAGSDASGRE